MMSRSANSMRQQTIPDRDCVGRLSVGRSPVSRSCLLSVLCLPVLPVCLSLSPLVRPQCIGRLHSAPGNPWDPEAEGPPVC